MLESRVEMCFVSFRFVCYYLCNHLFIRYAFCCLLRASQVKRCDEMLRKLRFFNDQITKADIMVSPKAGIQRPYDLDELEVTINSLWPISPQAYCACSYRGDCRTICVTS